MNDHIAFETMLATMFLNSDVETYAPGDEVKVMHDDDVDAMGFYADYIGNDDLILSDVEERELDDMLGGNVEVTEDSLDFDEVCTSLEKLIYASVFEFADDIDVKAMITEPAGDIYVSTVYWSPMIDEGSLAYA